MPMTIQAFILMDKNGVIIGRIDPIQLTPKIQGKFSPTTEFSKYKPIFSELEHAANNMLLSHADEIEKKIDAMDFYATRDDQPEKKLKFKRLQIMGGDAIFEPQQVLHDKLIQ